MPHDQYTVELTHVRILTLNQDISAAPLGILHKPATAPTDAQLPGMPSVAQLISGHLEHGGACIATAVVDLKHGKLYVVNAGDCRVIGVWKKEEEDQWFSAVLTEDHNGFNPGEVARSVDTLDTFRCFADHQHQGGASESA